MGSDFLTTLCERVIIADGGMGTLLNARGLGLPGMPGPALTLARPAFVAALHREYMTAGARLIETNSYGATALALAPYNLANKARDINFGAAKLARDAAKAFGNGSDRVWIAGAIGPIGAAARDVSRDECFASYRDQARALAEGGVDLLIAETFGDLDDLALAVGAIREAAPDLPLLAQMAFTQAGVTASGVSPKRMAEALEGLPVDVIGHNCGGGESAALAAARELVTLTRKPVSVFANRGLADLDDQGRPVYRAGPDYFGHQMLAAVECGVNIAGGCCGSTPADIEALARLVGRRAPAARPRTHSRRAPRVASSVAAIKRQIPVTELAPGGVAVIAEVDPPRGLNYGPELEGARKLLAAGVHSITIADNPLGVMRSSNLALATLLMRELGAHITLHVACRDRNLIGNQSHLFGAASLGITNVLAVTGDPVATETYKGASGVFDVSSTNLIRLIRTMNAGELSPQSDGELRTAFTIGAAFNSGVARLDAEAKRARRKAEAGADFFMTQPVFDLDTAHRILDLLEPLGKRVFIGVMPLVSERNAEFLHNEVPGISIPEHVRASMRGKQGKTGRAEGLRLSKELIEGFATRSGSVYLITPLGFYGMIAELADFARNLKPAKRL